MSHRGNCMRGARRLARGVPLSGNWGVSPGLRFFLRGNLSFRGSGLVPILLIPSFHLHRGDWNFQQGTWGSDRVCGFFSGACGGRELGGQTGFAVFSRNCGRTGEFWGEPGFAGNPGVRPGFGFFLGGTLGSDRVSGFFSGTLGSGTPRDPGVRPGEPWGQTGFRVFSREPWGLGPRGPWGQTWGEPSVARGTLGVRPGFGFFLAFWRWHV